MNRRKFFGLFAAAAAPSLMAAKVVADNDLHPFDLPHASGKGYEAWEFEEFDIDDDGILQWGGVLILNAPVQVRSLIGVKVTIGPEGKITTRHHATRCVVTGNVIEHGSNSFQPIKIEGWNA